jgi:hypothetical protein
MISFMKLGWKRLFAGLFVAWVGLPSLAHAYVDMAPTLAKIISDSRNIGVVEVVEFDRAGHRLTLREVRSLKGEKTGDPIRHDVASEEGTAVPRPILQWAAPGARAVLFTSRSTALVCIGQGWYQARSSGSGQWKIGKDRPDLPLAYWGSLSRLAEGVELMLAGKEAVLTVVAHGADDQAASFDLALNRMSVPELVRVQRIRANMRMPAMVMAASANPAYDLGVGSVDEAQRPELIEKLKSSDPMVRADAADDLRRLGPKAKEAREPLAKLLGDASPRVRFLAAAALLRIDPKDGRGIDPLSRGLDGANRDERREAVRAVGLAGSGAGELTPKVAALLKDSDESMKIAALQTIYMLGPCASKAVESVTPLLDDPNLAIDAADALGRIGPAAQPAPKQLTAMLSSNQTTVQWAAVRAMSQIGGREAHPAVDFIRGKMSGAGEVDAYNMMIYLALLGPVASDAVSVVQRAPLANPALPGATMWAIEADKSLPWQSTGGGFGGRGGMSPMGRGGMGGGGFDVALSIYEAMIRELGPRLQPTAKLLAGKIMDGTAGTVPEWGYEILTCGPEEAVTILAPHLADTDLVMRERSAVAIGYMGPAGTSAKSQVAAAIEKASSEREGRLMKWCLRQIDRQ